METIDWYADYKTNEHGLVPWLITHAMSEVAPGDWSEKFPNMDSSNLEVEMKINGVNVPVRDTLELIEKQLDSLILEKAKELVEKQFYQHENVLLALKNHVISQLNDGYIKDSLTNGEADHRK